MLQIRASFVYRNTTEVYPRTQCCCSIGHQRAHTFPVNKEKRKGDGLLPAKQTAAGRLNYRRLQYFYQHSLYTSPLADRYLSASMAALHPLAAAVMA